MTADAVGWASSAILVLTLGRQVLKQWREGTSEGVSIWLFAGQIGASAGFTVYSVLVRNWVFVVTNGLMLANGLAGYALVRRDRRRRRAAGVQRSHAERHEPVRWAYSKKAP